jgi:hypothetical protein
MQNVSTFTGISFTSKTRSATPDFLQPAVLSRRLPQFHLDFIT